MIPLAIAFTPNYFVPAATLLKSVLNTSAGSFEVVCMITDPVPQRMQDELQRMAGGRMTFRYLPLKGRLQGVYIDPRYTEAASLRLLLPELLPEYDRILYMDCDIIVRQDLARLWEETDLGDNYLAAVFEAPVEQQAERFRALGCDPDRYFNSGFLMMNLAAMRRDHLTERLLDACRVDYLEFPDQDALNQVCKGRVLPLSPLQNSIRTFFILKYKPDFVRCYSNALWYKVQRSATIHYTGGKPWDLFTIKFGVWWRVYEKLPREIRAEWTPDPQVYRLWRAYRIPPVRWVVDLVRHLKQTMA